MSGRRVRIVNHVPRHAPRHRFVERPVHADGFGLAACERAFDAAGDSGDRKVVAEDRNAGAADVANDRFEILKLLALLWTVEQHVVPMGGIEVFDRF